MVDQVRSQEAFARGRRDLAKLAGLHLTSKQVERSCEVDTERIRAGVEVQTDAMAPITVKSLRVLKPLGQPWSVSIKSASATAPASSAQAREPPI